MDILTTSLSAAVSAALSVPVAGWLAQKFIEGRLNKDLESYKAQIKRESDAEIESLKSRLQVSAKEREISINWLHQKRAAAIENLYSSLVELEYKTRVILDFMSPRTPDDIRKYTKEAHESIQIVYKTYLKSKIFLHLQTCQKTEAVLNAFQDPTAMYYGFLGVYDDHELSSLTDIKDHAWDELQERLIPAMNELEGEYRSILGVNI